MSTSLQAFIVNAFTRDGAGGNPAGIILDADDLDASRKLAIAREIGLSETAFVSRSASETVRLEFFTPARQIAHCGHATIATFALLRQLQRVGDGHLSKETIDGPREVITDGELVWMEQRAPRFDDIAPGSNFARRVEASLRVPSVIASTLVHTGNRFAVIEVADEATLAGIAPDFDAIAAISEEHDLIGYYVFVRTPGDEGFDATTRMFAPRYGIEEEAATGMAAGPLACVLHRAEGRSEWTFEQGRFMAHPSVSELRVRLDTDATGAITRLFAGGRAHVSRQWTLALPEA